MKNPLQTFSWGLIFLFLLSNQSLAEPAYAKWGKIAMEETNKKYDASIVDYLHIGREEISNKISVERFKLWLKKSNHEFGVIVSIKFHTNTEEIISIEFVEINH
jgi:hypothetical protein